MATHDSETDEVVVFTMQDTLAQKDSLQNQVEILTSQQHLLLQEKNVLQQKLDTSTIELENMKAHMSFRSRSFICFGLFLCVFLAQLIVSSFQKHLRVDTHHQLQHVKNVLSTSSPTLAKPEKPPPQFPAEWISKRQATNIDTMHFIYGLWDSNSALSDEKQDNIKKWGVISGMQTKLWEATEIQELVEIQFSDWLPLWSKLPPILKADVSRYMILHQFGGIYSDLDVDPINMTKCLSYTSKSVVVFIEGNKQGNGKENQQSVPVRQGFGEYDVRVANYLIVAYDSKSVLMDRVLRVSKARLENRERYDDLERYDVLFLTGPDVLTESVFGVRFPQDYMEKFPEDTIPAPEVEIVHRTGNCQINHRGKGKSWDKNKRAINAR